MEKKVEFLFSKEIHPFIIPKEKVVTASPDWSLERAFLVLSRNSTNSIPVINEEDHVEGLISKSNILDFMVEKSKLLLEDNRKRNTSTPYLWNMRELIEYKVRDAMNLNHGGILANSIFSFAFEVLVNRPYVPIIDCQSKFIGILTRKVMMEELIGLFRQEFIESFKDSR